ncbi:MAG: choice-of-anchor Q domain-containing protein [Dehalococcoidia bacterium]
MPQSSLRIAGAFLALLVVAALLGHSQREPAHAGGSFVVTTLTDPVPGACNSHCSLREAIKAANVGSDANIIVIPDIAPVGPDTFTLTRNGPIEDANAFGDLDIRNPVTIKGSGAANTIIDGNGGLLGDRVIQAACPSECAIRLQDLTLTGGAGGEGGGLLVSPPSSVTLTKVTVAGNTATLDGGGVSNESEFNAVHSTFSGNTAAGAGGGLANEGTMLLASVTVDGNTAATRGGGLTNAGDMTITNGTVYGNTANGTGIDEGGGGIFLAARTNPDGSVRLHSTTIANNTTASSGGGVGETADVDPDLLIPITQTLVFRNTIVADNNAAAFNGCGGVGFLNGTPFFESLAAHSSHEGNNVDEDGTCGGDIIGDPGLGPLAFNGGFVKTASIGVDSNALDAADPANPGSGGTSCPSLDARGIERPHDGDEADGPRCDVGAYEVGTCQDPFAGLLVATVPGLTGTDEVDVVIGTRYADVITLGERADVACGGRGNDRITGGDGADRLFGENGNDSLKGEVGDDELSGGSGKDLLDGGSNGQNGDLLMGGTQGDTLKGGLGANDSLLGEGGADKLGGGDGTGDACDGGDGGDAFLGADAAAAGCESSASIP